MCSGAFKKARARRTLEHHSNFGHPHGQSPCPRARKTGTPDHASCQWPAARRQRSRYPEPSFTPWTRCSRRTDLARTGSSRRSRSHETRRPSCPTAPRSRSHRSVHGDEGDRAGRGGFRPVTQGSDRMIERPAVVDAEVLGHRRRRRRTRGHNSALARSVFGEAQGGVCPRQLLAE